MELDVVLDAAELDEPAEPDDSVEPEDVLAPEDFSDDVLEALPSEEVALDLPRESVR